MKHATPPSPRDERPSSWLGWLVVFVAVGILVLALFVRRHITLFVLGLAFAQSVLVMAFFVETRARQKALLNVRRATQDLSQERGRSQILKTKEEAILSSIADGVFALDNEGTVILFNKAASAISGFKPEDIIGHPYDRVLEFVHEGDGKPKYDFIHEALQGEITSVANAMLLTEETALPVAISAAPIISGEDRQIGVIVVFRNVSHERQLEQAKDEFVSLVSHQLRAPLTAMRLFVEMLLDGQVGALNPQQNDYLKKVEVSTWRMIDLVNDFLNTSRLELNRLKMEPQEIHLEDLVASSVEEFVPLTEQKHINLSFTKPSLPKVLIEPSLYRQIINNLLTNAIRYTPENGDVTITLGQNEDDAYQLDVADTGIGIPITAQAKLFSRFYRADNARLVESEGSGLGLYLIKRILDLCGGKVWYDTEEGKGTTFHVIIPPGGMVVKPAAHTNI